MSNNPATESTAAQGMCNIEELSFVDQKCTFCSFSSFCQTPGYNPRERLFLTRNNGNYPGITGNNGLKPPKTTVKQGITGFCLSGQERRLRTLRRSFSSKPSFLLKP